MLDGWYCRSIANVQEENSSGGVAGNARAPGQIQVAPRVQEPHDYTSDSSSTDQEPEVNYRTHYLALKKKLKYLIYENECFQDALRSSQRRLLKVSRDRTFLLDRLLQYERAESSSESEATESSDDEHKTEQNKRRRQEPSNQHRMSTPPAASKSSSNVKRKRAPAPKKPPQNSHMQSQSSQNTLPKGPTAGMLLSGPGDGHMTPEEVERHLQSRQSYLELLPERAPPTVPTEMFSNDPSLDSESNDILENSPNVDEWIE